MAEDLGEKPLTWLLDALGGNGFEMALPRRAREEIDRRFPVRPPLDLTGTPYESALSARGFDASRFEPLYKSTRPIRAIAPSDTAQSPSPAQRAKEQMLADSLTHIEAALGLPAKANTLQGQLDAIIERIIYLQDRLATFVEISEDDAMHVMNLQLDDTGNSAARRRVNEVLTAWAQPAIARQREKLPREEAQRNAYTHTTMTNKSDGWVAYDTTASSPPESPTSREGGPFSDVPEL